MGQEDDREDRHHRRSSKSSHRESERRSSRHREEEIGSSYWESHSVKLEPVDEDYSRRRRGKEEADKGGSRVKVKKEKKDRERRKERRHSKRSSHDGGEFEGYHDDHEEVNEVQDGFEIDSVGKVENSEETLQKMKSAIIGILDEEIFTLANKI